MPRYVIAFHSPQDRFVHKEVEMDSKEAALRFFFTNYLEDEYTKDDEGFNYFSEDFNDPDNPLGSVLEV